MNCLFLTLKGAMRSWGATSIGDDRWTTQWPTSSAILGLTGACMGVDQHNPEHVAAWYNGFLVCSVSAVAYKKRYGNRKNWEHHPIMDSDYQTIRNSLNMDGKHRKGAIVSHRGYIADGLEISTLTPVHSDAKQWLQQLVFAVQQPQYTPFLGRREHPLSAPLTQPGEKVLSVNSVIEMCDEMISRLSKLSIGDLHPTRCLLRIPMGLLEDTTNFSKKWHFAGEELVADSRSGYLRTFKDRKVFNFYCDMENGE